MKTEQSEVNMKNIRVQASPYTLTSLEYATTGSMGGDAGHVGRSKLKLSLGNGAKIRVMQMNADTQKVTQKLFESDENPQPMQICLEVAGDWELQGLDEVLSGLNSALNNGIRSGKIEINHQDNI